MSIWTSASNEKRNGKCLSLCFSDLQADETNTIVENKKIMKTGKSESKINLFYIKAVNIHKFLSPIIKKSKYKSDNPFEINFAENEAADLIAMLVKEGLVDTENPCVVCATDKLEQDLWELIRKQLKIINIARRFSPINNEIRFNICANHYSLANNIYSPNMNHIQRLEPVAEFTREKKLESVISFIPTPNNHRQTLGVQIPQTPDADFVSNFLRNREDYHQNQEIQVTNPEFFEAQFSPLNLFGNSSPPHSPYFSGQVQNYFESDFVPNLLFTPNPFFVPDTPVSSNGTSEYNYTTPSPTPQNEVSFIPSSLVALNHNNVMTVRNGEHNYAAYVPNYLTQSSLQNYVVMDDNGVNLGVSTRTASRIQTAQMTQNNGYIANRESSQNNFVYNQQVALAMNNQNRQQQIINNTINDIQRDIQEQIMLGQRFGRKILGKKNQF